MNRIVALAYVIAGLAVAGSLVAIISSTTGAAPDVVGVPSVSHRDDDEHGDRHHRGRGDREHDDD